jgi:hypothetical protein
MQSGDFQSGELRGHAGATRNYKSVLLKERICILKIPSSQY